VEALTHPTYLDDRGIHAPGPAEVADDEPIDILFGSDRLRKTIDAGEDVGACVASWKTDEESFRQLRQKYLLY